MSSDYNLVVVNDFAHINGGAAQVALSSAIRMSQRGIKVSLFSAISPVMSQLSDSNVEVHCTNQYEIISDPDRLRAARQGIWNAKAAKEFNELLETMDKSKTIIHVHGWSKSLSSCIFRIAVKLGFEVVVTLHDYFIACPNGGFYNFKKKHICKLKGGSINCFMTNCDKRNYQQKLWRVARHSVQRLFGYLPGSVKHFITISDFSYDILKRYIPTDANIYHVSNPIEINKDRPVDPSRNEGVIFIGRLGSEKGCHLLAGASAEINMKVTFVGEGESRDEILQANPQANLTGWLERKRLFPLLSQSRALVLPSIWYETQGMVVLEAAALGIPAIVPDSSAAREMVVDGLTGLWFKGGDKDDLKRVLLKLEDDQLVTTMGRNAYKQFWNDPPTLDKHADRLQQVYLKILKSLT